jgi:hypothetical protein
MTKRKGRTIDKWTEPLYSLEKLRQWQAEQRAKKKGKKK